MPGFDTSLRLSARLARITFFFTFFYSYFTRDEKVACGVTRICYFRLPSALPPNFIVASGAGWGLGRWGGWGSVPTCCESRFVLDFYLPELLPKIETALSVPVFSLF